MTELSASTGTSRPGYFHAIRHFVDNVFAGYRRRQTLHELAALDDHLLADIGIDRAALSPTADLNGRVARDGLHMPRHLIG